MQYCTWDVVIFKKRERERITSIRRGKMESYPHYLAPSWGHPVGRGKSKFSTTLNVLATILSTYSVPSRWSHSCWRMRACHPEARTFMALPFRSRPETSTSRCRSTTALYPSTLASPGRQAWDHNIHNTIRCSFCIHRIKVSSYTKSQLQYRGAFYCVPETSLKEQRGSFTCALNLWIDNDLCVSNPRKSTEREKGSRCLMGGRERGKMYRREDQRGGGLVLRCPSWVHSWCTPAYPREQ
jgi:hypothetical protein